VMEPGQWLAVGIGLGIWTVLALALGFCAGAAWG
jgi:hypothetical protein